jgi:hypothetical protein
MLPEVGSVLAVTSRGSALTYLVVSSRAFLMQLESSKAELSGLRDPDLDRLLLAIEDAQRSVARVNTWGTRRLRAR